ncbi:hypothetical protein F4808DRAFT_454145 [Astrocystis sublimbata]|nr:hypothetical protein F4808DRAFT_454145 [Astrocystis sublimbata]
MHSKEKEPIAIVGSACHFAGNVDSASGLWELLRNPQDVRSVIPDDRFSAEGWYHSNGSYHGHGNVKQSYLISRDVRKFDAQFFNINPLEARSLDPQQSSLLEIVYEAVEAAGLTLEGLRGSDTGVYVGAMSADIEAALLRDTQTIPVYTTTCLAEGPSVTLDTACSSSLVAVHMAVQALRAGESNVAVACGINLILGPEIYVAMSKMWDQDANGYARGDGISVLVLKTLSKALADGDDIECVIRETGVNQDGNTSGGLTLPSSSAQKSLIRSVYNKAGLNPSKVSDQPQYFEAHGTGTPAGDPIEAAGIFEDFFQDKRSTRSSENPMYVGSVKTVIGHTEGSAGIADILKASLALQHACILPNLHFNKLNESLAPYYRNFEISTTVKPWPRIEGHEPRRASVNSFGIGGINAHAILESWNHMSNGLNDEHSQLRLFSPVVFSSGSQTSLRKTLLAYASFLSKNPTASLHDLAWTLRERRSIFRYRAAFSARSIDDLRLKISTSLSQGSDIGTPRVLGIFTGQGAQHARMGAELILSSVAARQIIRRLDSYLAELPSTDRPNWSLESELLAEPSRVGDAAGYITARDAIYIAYYRGAHLDISMEDASSLCAEPAFEGRVSVAASNSSSSVTISGDEDAIEELRKTLESQQAMNRPLRVDKAYHSSHVDPCLDDYLKSLIDRTIDPLQSPARKCTWYSSVTGRQIENEGAGLEGPYWARNLREPVLFSHAVKATVTAMQFDVALEVGAHPALQGPARQIIQEALEKIYPITAPSPAKPFVNLEIVERTMAPAKKRRHFRLLKGLPTYQWNHETSHWNESRISRRLRLRKGFHPLLGDMCADTGPHQLMFRNLLRESEIDWLQDHGVQGQTIFPAAGYISTMIEASQVLVDAASIQSVEMRDFYIHQALDFDENNDDGVEVLISLTDITRAHAGHIKAKFTYSAAMGTSADELTLAASADIDIILGQPSPALLPKRGSTPPHMVDVKPKHYYQVMDDLRYHFRGRFASLHSISRKHAASSCLVKMEPQHEEEASYGKPITVHPAELDSALQTVFLARGYPGDEQLSCLHLPQSCSLIRVNLLLAKQMTNKNGLAVVDSNVEIPTSEMHGFTGDIDVYPDVGENAALQFSGLTLKPLRQISEEDDRKVFYETHWVGSGLDGLSAASGDVAVREYHNKVVPTLVRIASFYLRKLVQSGLDLVSVHTASKHLAYYQQYVRHVISFLDQGQSRWMQKEWLDDTLEDVLEAGRAFPEILDVPLMHTVGQQMPRAPRGEVDMLEELRTSGQLDEYYATGFGLRESTQWVGRIVSQIADRYPHMKILEIGAGTGAATKRILAEVESKFLSYTAMDLSLGFAEAANGIFAQHRRKHPARRVMEFKVLDAERDPIEQGYKEGEYDLLVAFNVLHATAKLEETLHNLRKILRPGGLLVVVEPNNQTQPGGLPGFVFGSLPGWWLGVPEGRVITPLVDSAEGWHSLLTATGFSGIDQTPPKDFETTLGFTVFVSQAVDAHVHRLRAPLAALPHEPPISDFFVVSGTSERTVSLTEGIRELAGSFAGKVHVYATLEQVDHSLVQPDSVVVSLTDLDKPVFQDITNNDFLALKQTFTTPKNILWVTTGHRGEEPYSNITVAFGRTAVNETPGLCLQILDAEAPANLDARKVCEFALRLHTISSRSSRDGNTLWSFEPETVIDPQGRELLPRLRHNSVLNDRYNSVRRDITWEIDHRSAAITRVGNKWVAKELSPETHQLKGEKVRVIDINTTHTMNSAIRTRWGYGFLASGIEPASQTKYLALVSFPASVLRISPSSAIRCPDTHLSDGALLTLLAAQLVASAIFISLWDDSRATIVITTKASLRNMKALVMADSHMNQLDVSDASRISLCPYIVRSALKKILTSMTSCFVGLTPRVGAEVGHNHDTALSCLPPHCRRETLDTLFSAQGSDGIADHSTALANFLRQAVYDVTRLEGREADLINEPLTVIDWTTSDKISVPVTRLDCHSLLFEADKTYWIIMTGKIATSLCDWMAKKGARTIVLTSRNPQIDEHWIAAHARNGVTVAVLPGQVESCCLVFFWTGHSRAVKDSITANYPPISGVMNGAVVMEDVSISNTSFSQLVTVLGPKVQGSTNLHRLFADANTDPLDFFILFSSVTAVYGNPGQAGYVAANAYMGALAAQRQRCGLAATAIDLGSIFGVGYWERGQGRALDLTISKYSFMHLSEADLHQIIAEAINCGRAGGPAILSTGLEPVAADAADLPVWAENPRFAAFLMHETGEDGKTSKDGVPVAVGSSISDKLQKCATRQDVEAVVKGALAARLRKALQLTTADDDDLMSMHSREIGIDSLVLVDIRAWCLENFEVAVPVLKIMNNDTLASLALHVSNNVPTELVPNVEG